MKHKPRKCLDCDNPAQTQKSHRNGGWSPWWCIECDEKRIARITASFEGLVHPPTEEAT